MICITNVRTKRGGFFVLSFFFLKEANPLCVFWGHYLHNMYVPVSFRDSPKGKEDVKMITFKAYIHTYIHTYIYLISIQIHNVI